jgi:hypothetical protein
VDLQPKVDGDAGEAPVAHVDADDEAELGTEG